MEPALFFYLARPYVIAVGVVAVLGLGAWLVWRYLL